MKKAERVADKPKKRHWFVRPWRDPKLLLGMAPLAAGIALDHHSTSVRLRRCPGCAETNPFLGLRPSDKRIALTAAGFFALNVYFASWAKNYGEELAREKPLGPKRDWLTRNAFIFYSAGLGTAYGLTAKSTYDSVRCPSGYYKPAGQPGCVQR